MKPKYIQALGGAMVFAGSLMPWMVPSGGGGLIGTQLFTGLPAVFGGPLIALAALVSSKAPGARGSWLAALLGLLAFLYMVAEATTLGSWVGLGVWVCLLGGLLAFAGGMMKNPGATPQLPQPPTPSQQVQASDAPLDRGETATEASSPLEAMPKATPKVPALGIVILATLLGCLVPNIIVGIRERSYQKVFSPPEKVVEILTGNASQLYVRTGVGTVFFCDVYEKESPCKEIALESVPKAQTPEPTPSRASYSPPPAPGKVITSYESYEQYPDASSFAKWVILDDGSVWTWRSTCAMFGCTSIPLTEMMLGTFVGFLAGVFIVEAMRKSRQESHQGQPAEAKTSDARLDQGEVEEGEAARGAAEQARSAEADRAHQIDQQSTTLHEPTSVDSPVSTTESKTSPFTRATSRGSLRRVWIAVGLLGALALAVIGVSLISQNAEREKIAAQNQAILAADIATAERKTTLAVGTMLTRTIDGMTMVYAPAGTFMMGSDNGDSDEKPVHSVTLDAFWIDRTEVTNAQYAQCVAARQCSEPRAKSSYSRASYYNNPEYANYPVSFMGWEDATKYCQWAGGQLPTEAQWEYAARGPQSYIYPWGNGQPNDELLNYRDRIGDTTPVGSYPGGASWVGALDMAGNVEEWVEDRGVSYPGSPQTNPTGPTTGNNGILRGGYWGDGVSYVRSTYRFNMNPDNRGDFYGFRCVAAPGG